MKNVINKAKKYQFALFDLDGTLTDSKTGIFNSLREMLHTYGKELSDEVLNTFIGPPIGQSLKKYFEMDEDAITEATRRFRFYYDATGIYQNILLPGVVPMLCKLQDAGVTLAVATSKTQDAAWKVLDRFSLSGFFTVVSAAISDKDGCSKAFVVNKALKHLCVDERNIDSVIMVGDRSFDVTGAAENGLQTIGFTAAGYAEPNELKDAGAIFVTNDTLQITKFILGEQI